MKALRRGYKYWITGFFVAFSVMLLTSCQSLGGGSSTGTNGSLSLSNSSLNFGNVAVGAGKSLQDALTNSTSAALTINAIQASNPAFTIQGISTPLTIGPSQSVPFTVQFQPSTNGDPAATISFAGSGGQTFASLQVQGDGVAQGQLAMTPSSLSFGNVKVGGTQSSSVVVSNSGGTDVTINQATLSGAGFSMNNLALPLTLAPGATASVTVTFAPPSSGAYSGSISFATSAAQSNSRHELRKVADQSELNSQVALPLSGTGVTQGALSPNLSSLSFGNIQVGTGSNLSESLTNTGGSPVTITQSSVTGAGFSMSGLTLPLTLNANQSASFTVTFDPTVSGTASGTLNIVSNASNSTLAISLSGSGLAAGSLTASPASFSFGSVQVSTSKSLAASVTNTGGESVTISSSSITGTGFTVSGLSLPMTLSGGQSASFTILFDPAAAGSTSGALTITSNASNSSLSIPLSGTGITQGGLSPSPSSISLGNVTVGTSSSQSETLTNSGGTSVTISAASVSVTGFTLSGLSLPVTLAAGQSASFNVTFAPATTGTASGNITITSNGSNPSLSIPVAGTGVSQGTLSPNPSSLSLGSVAIGSSASVSETLTNSGGSSVTISAVNVSGSGFSISGLNLPMTLTPNQSVTFTATFAPTSSGAASGTLIIASNGSNPGLSIGLSGTGTATAQLSLSQTSLSFGTIADGSSSSLSANLTAAGSSVTVSSATSNNSEFVLSGISLPVTIPAGQSVSFTVTFTPSAPGSASGNLSFTSNASGSPTVQSLTGTGQPWVGLSWQPTSGASSYNVYRKLSTDQSYTQIDSGDSSTSYTDNSVTAGTTYDYVVTAVNSENQESSYSNMAQAAVPNN